MSIAMVIMVICFVSDGAKPNRKCLKGLGFSDEKKGVYYMTINCYSTDRYIYFMPDVPHLIKPTRNCWYYSKSGGTRYMTVRNLIKNNTDMQINGKHILWEHL